MLTIFVIGGMGAGKSTARKALVDQGLDWLDLDQIGHDVLMWETVKTDLLGAFGTDIFDPYGEVSRPALARKAFESPAQTRKLNRITMPRIEELFVERLDELKHKGCKAVVVEYSVYKNRASSIGYAADIVIGVLAPLDVRLQRAVAAGWAEDDVRRRIAQQVTDAERIEESDVVFSNDGTKEELYNKVVSWWNDYAEKEGIQL